MCWSPTACWSCSICWMDPDSRIPSGVAAAVGRCQVAVRFYVVHIKDPLGGCQCGSPQSSDKKAERKSRTNYDPCETGQALRSSEVELTAGDLLKTVNCPEHLCDPEALAWSWCARKEPTGPDSLLDHLRQ